MRLSVLLALKLIFLLSLELNLEYQCLGRRIDSMRQSYDHCVGKRFFAKNSFHFIVLYIRSKMITLRDSVLYKLEENSPGARRGAVDIASASRISRILPGYYVFLGRYSSAVVYKITYIICILCVLKGEIKSMY
jgi:hypothetical protein